MKEIISTGIIRRRLYPLKKITRYYGWLIQKHSNSNKKNNVWVFGEWYGNRCCDNCLYFANYIAKTHPEINTYWIAKETSDLSMLHLGVHRVIMDSEEANTVLKIASVVIVNQGIIDISSSEKLCINPPVFLNLWHGVAWKKIGIDVIPNSNPWKRRYAKAVLKVREANYYLATSPEFQSIVHRANCVKNANIIKAGYPRNTIFYDIDMVYNCYKKLKKSLKLNFSSENHPVFIAYMPTFRDKTNNSFSFDNISDCEKLNMILKSYNAFIIQKAHFAKQNKCQKSKADRVINLNDFPAQELLAASDILITDYSSCFFDYLILNRPIIHFIYDYEYYKNEDRGLYYTKEEVTCGSVAMTEKELLNAIEENLSNPEKYAKLRLKQKNKFMTFDNECSCPHIFDQIQRALNKT